MGLPIYIRKLPDTDLEREPGHVAVDIGDMELIATIALYRRFIERELARLAQWDQTNRVEGAEIYRLRGDGAH